MNRRVLVTGGTVRIGLAISSLLRELGYEVFTTSHRPDANADFTIDFRRDDWTLPKFDCVVNNAALYVGSGEDIRKVDFAAPKRIIDSQIAPSVVNILDARVLAPDFIPRNAYEESKLDLLNETRRFHPGVRVNGVAPGPVLAPVEISEKAEPTPFGRPTPEAVARAVAFLVGEPTVSGSIIAVDGGACFSARFLV